MAVSTTQDVLTVQATENIAASALGKAVTLGGTIADGINMAAGILQSYANSGEYVSAAYAGLFKADFGAAVSTVGWGLSITTSGWVTAAASGAPMCGRALSVVASGGRAQALFDFRNFGFQAT